MSHSLNVSQEFIVTGGNKFFAPELMSRVEQLATSYRNDRLISSSAIDSIVKLVKTDLGLTIEFRVDDQVSGPNAYCIAPVFYGHNVVAAGALGAPSTTDHSDKLFEKIRNSTVDLNKAKVTGALSEYKFTIAVSADLLSDSEFTTAEVTAIILHELGHAFFMLATLGEYCWLNYYLTDGVDVVLGRKPNRYKIELLNSTYLAKHATDAAYLKDLKHTPSEANVRRAILDVTHRQPHNLLTTQVVRGAIKRNEQLADVFVARLGYGVHLATGLARLDRYPGNISGRRFGRTRIKFVFMEVVKLITGVLGITAGVMIASVLPHLGVFIAILTPAILSMDGAFSDQYDNPTERLVKIRRELITQLKSVSFGRLEKDAVVRDIQILDHLLDNRNQFISIWEALGHVLSPGSRREHHRLKHEELLEKLMSNDLFLQAHRFGSH